jgi:hypothetical protein
MGEQGYVKDWRKSSASANGETCVEVGTTCGGVAVRDTTDRDGVTLSMTAGAWTAFLAALR